MKVNFGNVAKNYARFRNDLPIELLESLKLRGINFNNKNVADLGSGTGVLSRALYREGAVVVGVEPSNELIQEAKEIDKNEGYMIKYVHAFSESTTLLEDTYDYITVLRAWHWFDSDKTLTEIKRILKDNGSLIVMDSGFLSKNKVIVDTLEIIKGHMPNGKLKSAGSKANSKQVINGFPVEWFKEWQEHQFDLQETYKFTYNVTFTNEEWCGRVGSLSWLSGFDENERNKILDKIYSHLNKEFKGIKHNILHGCYITVLSRL
ncbi:class I SAM-dependent methyltransferase [Halalkalibacter alkaliphilus]|uniref:Class I SAM-dependent methyltransferase n=1 Tax=Halalkalibacter alkaliphilus TaxID=2917993 RepID=A0A9X2I884_9BACI|nr:class I SAM-dependent methyltransferase [Halalkalibacter alkaliphilus]MCL7749588.1 class I SAM-dependent methyltransferase [Halalkalibacter alkaliphilus]